MPYMIYQQYITAIKENYAGREDLKEMAAGAKNCRIWMQGLEIDKNLRDSLVEPVQAIEEAFLDLLGKK